MGEHVNGALARWLGWATTVLMLIAAVALFATGGVQDTSRRIVGVRFLIASRYGIGATQDSFVNGRVWPGDTATIRTK